MTPSSIPTLRLSDLLDGWPFTRMINPHHEEVAAESAEWIEGLDSFDEAYLSIFKKCNFGLLGSLAYPNASREHLVIFYQYLAT
ncbi:hypothetical protein SISNIDRAFT_541101 [Sistotremastrum niveocremeum HHB9708]|uniref:Uncharacterized protein n=1 Tax=Sistotremastrum niveocremeum HHB9708 TaxID=1314777 RepID=A0A164MMS5_9AGAM|nr:hypothetical protein SISNIDRAFT_541101 [Sistotremastrum niveocremeum HHB9708]